MKVLLLIAALAAALILFLRLRRKKNTGISADANSVTIGDLTLTTSQQIKLESVSEEGFRALKDMAQLYAGIEDREIRRKINQLMMVTDQILQEAKTDPADLPQIRKFFNYFLPTTIRLLETYRKMESQPIEGDNIRKTRENISEMLDTAIDAYQKRLDSLFANQAMDVEADISVMTQMLQREGLMTSNPDFK